MPTKPRHWDHLHARSLTKRINHAMGVFRRRRLHQSSRKLFLSPPPRRSSALITISPGRISRPIRREMAWREDNRRVSNGEQYLDDRRGLAGASGFAPVEGLLAACHIIVTPTFATTHQQRMRHQRLLPWPSYQHPSLQSNRIFTLHYMEKYQQNGGIITP